MLYLDEFSLVRYSGFNVCNFRFHKVWQEMNAFWFWEQEFNWQCYKRLSSWVSRVSWLCGVMVQGAESFRRQAGKRQHLVAHCSLQAFLEMAMGHGWELCKGPQVMQRLSLSDSSWNWAFWWNLSVKLDWIVCMKNSCWVMNRCIIEHPKVWLEFIPALIKCS